MRQACLGLCLVMLAAASFPDDLSSILAASSPANPAAVSLGIDRELAELRYEKSRIEARKERDLLSAEMTFIAAQESQRSSLQGFCYEVIDAVFNAAAAAVDLRVASLSAAAASEEQLAADKQHERGLLSEEESTNAGLKLRSARLALAEATWALEDAEQQLQTATGLEWRESLVSSAPDIALPSDSTGWTASYLGLRKAEIAARLAELDLAALPGNAALYDRRIAEAALRKASMALEQARKASERGFRSAIQTLQSQKSAIALRQGDIELQQSLLADAERRYNRSAIARGERDQQQIRVWNAEKAHLQALRSYLRSVVSYLVSTGSDPRVAR